MNFNDNYKYAVVYQHDCDTAIRSFNRYPAAFDFAHNVACKFSRSGASIKIFEQRAKGHWQLGYSFVPTNNPYGKAIFIHSQTI